MGYPGERHQVSGRGGRGGRPWRLEQSELLITINNLDNRVN